MVVELVLAAFAAVAFLGPSSLFLSDRSWSREMKGVVVTSLVVVGLTAADVVGSEAMSVWSDRIGVAPLVGLLLEAEWGTCMADALRVLPRYGGRLS